MAYLGYGSWPMEGSYGPLDGQQTSAELHALSEQCCVGECDVFLSHSWHDDSRQKWDALGHSSTPCCPGVHDRTAFCVG